MARNQRKMMAEYRLPPLRILFPMSLVAVLFCGLLIYPWQSLGGSGLDITLNLLAWSVIGIAGLWMLPFLSRHRWQGGQVAVLLFSGALLMSLPWLWTSDEFKTLALYRLAGLWGLAILLWLLVQIPVRGEVRRGLYGIIVIAALLQAFVAGWQTLFPLSAAKWLHYNFLVYGGRANGQFRQANLLGSFLASGLLCALWLSVSARSKRVRLLMRIAVVPICAGVMLSESRTGALGVLIGVIVLLTGVKKGKHRRGIILLMLVAIMAGQSARMLRPSVVSISKATAHLSQVERHLFDVERNMETARRGSNRLRLLLVQGTYLLIKTHPLMGNGLGSFETAFPAILARHGQPNTFWTTVEHPHNEILYVWSEGGLIALSGLICWLVLLLVPFSSARALLSRRKKYGLARNTLCRGTLILPLMLHSMTEFPLYLSALHGALLVILVWLALPVAVKRPRANTADMSQRTVQFGLSVICVCGVTFMVTGVQSAYRLHDAERANLQNITLLREVMNPYAQPDRLQFDRAVSDLMQFNMSRNTQWLFDFQTWAGNWLQRHNDANLTDSMMRIAAAQQDAVQAGYWRRRGCLSFWRDRRFHCAKSNFSLGNASDE